MTRQGVEAAVVGAVLALASLGLLGGCQSSGGGSASAGSPRAGSGGSTTSGGAGSGAAGSSVPPGPATTATTPSPIEGVTCFGDAVVQGQSSGPAPSIPTTPAVGATPPLQIGPTITLSTPPPAISGGTLLVLPGDVTAVAADPDRDRIYIVDLAGNSGVETTISLQPGDEPGRVILDGSGRVEVALRGGGALVTVDPGSGALLQRRAVCAAPRGLAYEAKRDLIHVACADGQLVSLPAAGGAPVRRVQLDDDLRDVVVDGDHLLVSRFRSAEILTVDSTGALTARTELGGFRSPQARGGQLFTPAVAWRMVAMPGGGAAMMHQRGVDDQIQRGQPGHVVPGSYGGSGFPQDCDGIVHSAVSRLKADGTISAGPALANVPLPVDLAVSADGRQIAMVSAGNDGNTDSPFGSRVVGAHIGDVDSITSNVGASCRPDAGSTICWGQTTSAPLSCNPAVSLGGQLIAVAFLASGEIVTQSREPAYLGIAGTTIPLTSDSRADTGHLLFHFNAGAGLACASCHPEGGDDGRTWNFTCTGRRRTQSLQTGLRGTEPFHWDGDEKDFTQLSTDVFTGRMSGPQLMPDQADAVLSWLDAQPRVKRPAPTDAAAVQRGQVLFNRAVGGTSCATCHAGPHLTNNQTVDVGTGVALQVPSLVGIANHPPYMHTGCAKTLLDRFTPACGGGDLHGVTSGLAASELTDLVSYLQTL